MKAKRTLKMPRWWLILAGVVMSLAMLAIPAQHSAAQNGDGDDEEEDQSITTPDDCASCHSEEYEVWEGSTHAGALNDPVFIEGWNRAGNPDYCKNCHATGYDALTGNADYEGVGCTACHTDTKGKHPATDMTVDKSSELCGSCHAGPHAPAYNEWLASDHATMNIGCTDCHQSHNTSLHLENPTELCASCHKSLDEDMHGEAGMACHDCHMAEGDTVVDPLSGQTNGAGHTFGIPSNVCAKCHGMTHTLSPDGTTLSPVPESQEPDVEASEASSSQQVNLALTAGGFGGLFIGVIVPMLLNRRGGKHDSAS
jgi:hypothetical protein